MNDQPDTPATDRPLPPDTPLHRELVEVLESELRAVVEGSAEDLRTFATRIASNALAAAATGRADLVDECRRQAVALAERQRLRANAGQWRVFDAVVGTLIRTLAVASSTR